MRSEPREEQPEWHGQRPTREVATHVTHERVSVNGAYLFCERTGNGPPLVFIPQTGADRRMWHDQVIACAQQYEMICYDLRGWGKSPRRKGVFRHAEDLTALLDWLGIERAALVAYWDGAGIALDLALDRPELVAALILVEPMVDGWRPRDQVQEFNALLESIMAAAAYHNPVRRIVGMAQEGMSARQAFWTGAKPRQTWRRRWAVERMHAIKGGNLLHTLGVVYGWRPFDWHHLRFADETNRDRPGASYSDYKREPPVFDVLEQVRVTAPTLIVRGLPTASIFMEQDEDLRSRLADAQIAWLADATGLPHMIWPDRFNLVVLDFLRRVYLPR
ncbi:MAG TPA: alpha/beta hydrolase [Ktedonobacterales bacterium]|nr:alpha/beta hydrolase [Ktedonobacterales bacterium]